jgi:hypothetical protein
MSSSDSCNQDHDIPLTDDDDDYMEEDEDEDDELEHNEQTSNVTYLCSVCPYKSFNVSSVQRHLIIHSTGHGVICPVCSLACSSHKLILRHMKAIHPASSTVTKFISTARIDDAHIVEQHHCSRCSYRCNHADALSVHQRLEHNKNDFDNQSSSSSSTTTTIDNDIDKEIDDDKRLTTNDDMFQCPRCHLSSSTCTYADLQHLTVHVFTDHINHIENNQSCPFCSFIAHKTSSYTLLEHIKLHFNGTLVQPDALIGLEHVKELLID